MASRRKSREFAMQMLYQWELGGNTPEQVGTSFFNERKAESDVESFARGLFRGTVESKDKLDQLIQDNAVNWRLERMAAVDRCILRLAVYELLNERETPPSAVINEARTGHALKSTGRSCRGGIRSRAGYEYNRCKKEASIAHSREAGNDCFRV